ncbi:MAG: hypothetical protein ACQESR_28815 [Planctomycetota bacterium]
METDNVTTKGLEAVLGADKGGLIVESCPTQAVFPLVGLAAEKVIRDRYTIVAENTNSPMTRSM